MASEELLLIFARKFVAFVQWVATAIGCGPPVWIACKELVFYRVSVIILLGILACQCMKKVKARRVPTHVEGFRVGTETVAHAIPVANVIGATSVRQRHALSET